MRKRFVYVLGLSILFLLYSTDPSITGSVVGEYQVVSFVILSIGLSLLIIAVGLYSHDKKIDEFEKKELEADNS